MQGSEKIKTHKPEQKKLFFDKASKNQLKSKQKINWINPLKDRTRVKPFIVPDKELRAAALGSLAGTSWRLKKSLQAIIEEFNPIKQPQAGDNLYEYQEEGQDYPLFSSIARNHIDKETQIIYIVPFKCSLPKQVITKIRNKARAFFAGVKVKVSNLNEGVDLNLFNERASENGQKYYDASKMNNYFKKVLPKNTYSVAVITSLLIYNGDRFEKDLDQTWVYGLGSIRDRTSVTSYEQVLRKHFGGQKQEGEELDQFNIQMLGKIVNHELCHTFAMKHCIYYTCLMNGSNGYHEASTKSPHLCPVCLRKLQSQLKFDIMERYEVLGDDKSKKLASMIKAELNLSK